MSEYNITHLKQLEAEGIHIMREVAAEFDKPVMLYSVGKDSAVMLHLALKAFYPGKIPFPLMHVDTTWKFKEMITFRDQQVEKLGLDIIVHTNLEGVDAGIGPFTHGSDSKFDATIVWMAETPLLPGNAFDFKLGSKTVSGRLSTMRSRIDVNTFEKVPAPGLELNEIGLAEINLDQTVCFDRYKDNRATGSFIIIDRLSNVTVGAGMIDCERSESTNIIVTKGERPARYGQKPATIMFVGVSGSGKSTLAHGLERKLFDRGRVSTVLDGKTMRLGISKDLPHDAEGRAENLRRSAHIARFLNDSGVICCASFVAPNADSREHAISVIGKDNCYIIYLNPPMETCIQRDPSGLYAAAQGTESTDIPGLSFSYSAPEVTRIELDTKALSVDECLEKVLKIMRDEEII